MRTFARVRPSARAAIIVSMCLALSACDFGQWLIDVLNAIGMLPEKTVRISGASYFKLDAKDSKDRSFSQGGYLCVVHNPGCGGSGNDGTDTFFQIKQVPPLAQIVGFEFEPVPPNGMAASYSGIWAPSGSFDTVLQPGPTDGSQTVKVRWHNACWDKYGGLDAVYRVSMTVKIKGDVDLGDDKFDTGQPMEKPACRSDSAAPPPPPIGQPSGFLGSIIVCNADEPSSVLHLKANYAGTGSSGSNKTTMSEDIPIQFTFQAAGVWVASFRTQQIYQQGGWNITSVTLDGNYGALSGLPRSQGLPGGVGEPIFDFRGGPCQVP